MEVTLRAEIACRACRGTGIIRGSMRRMTGGSFIREERDCENCGGIGAYSEDITLGGAALRELAQALAVAAEGLSADTLMAQDAWADNFGKSGS